MLHQFPESRVEQGVAARNHEGAAPAGDEALGGRRCGVSRLGDCASVCAAPHCGCCRGLWPAGAARRPAPAGRRRRAYRAAAAAGHQQRCRCRRRCCCRQPAAGRAAGGSAGSALGWEKEARTSAGLSMGAPEVCASPRSAAECRLELTWVEVEWEPEEEAEGAEEEEEEEEESDDIASPAACCRSVAHSSVQLSDSLCVEPEEQPGGAELLAAESGSSRTKAAKSAVRKLRSKIASRIKAAVRACVLRHLL
ncbi:hypothetical protein PLESTM_001692300 [Pleodorina starrii]|nr:hypothetical protein PLESTM_001692300 [Pleodorina starrii]